MTRTGYSSLTPFLVPPAIAYRKKQNIGDGFILERIQAALLPSSCRFLFSSWAPLSRKDVEKINTTKALVVAGANQLTPDFNLGAGTDRALIDDIEVPILPFGVGLHGAASGRLTASAKRLLELIHERSWISSWRCPATVRYLVEQLPSLAGRALDTSCPVVYDEPVLSGRSFETRVSKVLITVTERAPFWDRESRLLEYVTTRFAGKEVWMSLHQQFAEPGVRDKVRGLVDHGSIESVHRLHRAAERAGVGLYVPRDVHECRERYREFDLHVGSRLHAHLFFLSQARRTFLLQVDDRAPGFAESLEFRLVSASNLGNAKDLHDDFEHVASRIRARYPYMADFVDYARGLIQ